MTESREIDLAAARRGRAVNAPTRVVMHLRQRATNFFGRRRERERERGRWGRVTTLARSHYETTVLFSLNDHRGCGLDGRAAAGGGGQPGSGAAKNERERNKGGGMGDGWRRGEERPPKTRRETTRSPLMLRVEGRFSSLL